MTALSFSQVQKRLVITSLNPVDCFLFFMVTFQLGLQCVFVVMVWAIGEGDEEGIRKH